MSLDYSFLHKRTKWCNGKILTKSYIISPKKQGKILFDFNVLYIHIRVYSIYTYKFYYILYMCTYIHILDFPGGSDGKSVCLQCRRPRFDPWVRKMPWRRKWQPTPVLLPGKSHGRRSLVGYSQWCRKELGMTERLHFHFHIYSHDFWLK